MICCRNGRDNVELRGGGWSWGQTLPLCWLVKGTDTMSKIIIWMLSTTPYAGRTGIVALNLCRCLWIGIANVLWWTLWRAFVLNVEWRAELLDSCVSGLVWSRTDSDPIQWWRWCCQWRWWKTGFSGQLHDEMVLNTVWRVALAATAVAIGTTTNDWMGSVRWPLISGIWSATWTNAE